MSDEESQTRITLSKTEAERIANSLEELYYDTQRDAYTATDRQAAKDAMEIRDRANIKPNPDLLG